MKPLSFLLTAWCVLYGGLLAETKKPETGSKGKAAAIPTEAETEDTDFVRFEENKKGAQLQTAIATYRNKRGVTVDLIGAIHIADKNYYDVLNVYFDGYDSLLYEMVGDPVDRFGLEEEEEPEADDRPAPPPSKAPKPFQGTPPKAGQDKGERSIEERVRDLEDYINNNSPKMKDFEAEDAAREKLSWLHPMYDVLKNTLKLEAQMECIDYTKKNFVHADMTARAFAQRQEERGEGFLQLWVRMMQAQALSPHGSPKDPGLLKILEILCRPDSATELKRLMGRMFDSVEAVMSGMEGPDGSVIISERNKVALEVLKIHLGLNKKRFGIFYGAAHLPDMEKRLLEMGFVKEKVEWLTAWDLPPEPPPYKKGAQPGKTPEIKEMKPKADEQPKPKEAPVEKAAPATPSAPSAYETKPEN